MKLLIFLFDSFYYIIPILLLFVAYYSQRLVVNIFSFEAHEFFFGFKISFLIGSLIFIVLLYTSSTFYRYYQLGIPIGKYIEMSCELKSSSEIWKDLEKKLADGEYPEYDFKHDPRIELPKKIKLQIYADKTVYYDPHFVYPYTNTPKVKLNAFREDNNKIQFSTMEGYLNLFAYYDEYFEEWWGPMMYFYIRINEIDVIGKDEKVSTLPPKFGIHYPDWDYWHSYNCKKDLI